MINNARLILEIDKNNPTVSANYLARCTFSFYLFSNKTSKCRRFPGVSIYYEFSVLLLVQNRDNFSESLRNTMMHKNIHLRSSNYQINRNTKVRERERERAWRIGESYDPSTRKFTCQDSPVAGSNSFIVILSRSHAMLRALYARFIHSSFHRIVSTTSRVEAFGCE